MTKTPRRWKLIAEKVRTARERGDLGVIAASTKVPEYKLHDFAQSKGNLTPAELRRLYGYFEGKSQ